MYCNETALNLHGQLLRVVLFLSPFWFLVLARQLVEFGYTFGVFWKAVSGGASDLDYTGASTFRLWFRVHYTMII